MTLKTQRLEPGKPLNLMTNRGWIFARTSILDRVRRSIMIDLDRIPDDHWLAYCRGDLIHKALPLLTADEREFMLSGTTPDQWETLTQEPDDANAE